jgi:hypothetical protein
MARMTLLAKTEPTRERDVTRTPPASEPVLKALSEYRSEPPSIRDLRSSATGEGPGHADEIQEPPPSSSLLDPIPVMTVKMGDLANASSLEHAANVGASALARALRARAVLVHLHDVKNGTTRVLGTDGATAKDSFGVKEIPANDEITASVIASQRPLSLRFEDEPSALPRRLALLGAERSYVCVPVTLDRGRVAIVEVVDADARFGTRVIDASEYVADRLVPFLTMREARSA